MSHKKDIGKRCRPRSNAKKKKKKKKKKYATYVDHKSFCTCGPSTIFFSVNHILFAHLDFIFLSYGSCIFLDHTPFCKLNFVTFCTCKPYSAHICTIPLCICKPHPSELLCTCELFCDLDLIPFCTRGSYTFLGI